MLTCISNLTNGRSLLSIYNMINNSIILKFSLCAKEEYLSNEHFSCGSYCEPVIIIAYSETGSIVSLVTAMLLVIVGRMSVLAVLKRDNSKAETELSRLHCLL